MNRILITGGAGYLGRAIVRRISSTKPETRFVIYSRDEAKHVYMRRFTGRNVSYVLGDVRDQGRLETVFQSFRPDTVLHLAALKYVPQSEDNVEEAFSINVLGSEIIALGCARYDVERAIAISTDKACRPVSVYGATKFVMERMWQRANDWGETKYNLVRYGNVVASTGSVVSVFKEQLKRDGTITLTNPDMTRFWLTIDDAVDLVCRALREPTGGTVIVPELHSMTMMEVAQACILHFEGAPDLDGRHIEVVGVRQGEKQHEDLLAPTETPYTTPMSDFESRYPLWRLHDQRGGERLKLSDGINSKTAKRLSQEQFRQMIIASEGQV